MLDDTPILWQQLELVEMVKENIMDSTQNSYLNF